MATEIGFVKVLVGTATATSSDGTQRNLLVGDRIHADEIITTGAVSAIELEFSDGSLMDLGRNSQAILDTGIFDPQQSIAPSSDVNLADLQDILLDGDDPTQQGDATAAGPESDGNEGGISTVTVEHETPTVKVTSGFESSRTADTFINGSSRLLGEPEDNALPAVDGETDTAKATVTIDDPTVTISDVATTDEGTILSVNAAHGVLSNDTDVDSVLTVNTFTIAGDNNTYSAGNVAIITNVGTLTIESDGSYIFTPDTDYDGVVPVAHYTTNTGASESLTISISGINDAPIADTASGTFNEDQLAEPAVPQTGSENLLDGLTDVDDTAGHVVGTVSDNGNSYQEIASDGSTQIKVEFNYEDENGDSQTIYIPVRVDADGEYHVSQSGLLDAIPEGNVATGSFFYQINDNNAVNNLSEPQEFTITINGENDAPEFNVTSLSNEGDIPVTITLSGDSYNTRGQDAPKFIVSVDGVALNGGNPLTVEELRSYRIDNELGAESRETSWEFVTFNVPAGTSSVAVQFVNDAYEGGSDRDGDGYSEDRNLIIDSVNVGGEITGSDDNLTVTGGTTLQAEDPSVSTYIAGRDTDRSGRETMAWSGTMTFDVTEAVNNATPTSAFQTESFAEDSLSNSTSVTGTVSLLDGVSDVDDVANVITIGTINGNTDAVGTSFDLDLSYDDGSGPQIITVQVTVAADGMVA